jgi:hypothetical protein
MVKVKFFARTARENLESDRHDGSDSRESNSQAGSVAATLSRYLDFEALKAEFLRLLFSQLGTAKSTPYEIELRDPAPVRSYPYRSSPPKLGIFKRMVNELLEQGVARPSKSSYATPAFLVPKSDGQYRLVVNYRKVNARIHFDGYPLPTVEQAFEQFSGAIVFSVFDLNSAYFQIPFSAHSRRITAFCTPFGLYEFNKLPMGISVGGGGKG